MEEQSERCNGNEGTSKKKKEAMKLEERKRKKGRDERIKIWLSEKGR